MKIKMLTTVNGKVDGVRMGPYSEGHEYEVDEKTAKLFIGSAMAEEVVPIVEPVEEEPVKPRRHNK